MQDSLEADNAIGSEDHISAERLINPVVQNDMKIVSRLWANDIEDEAVSQILANLCRMIKNSIWFYQRLKRKK